MYRKENVCVPLAQKKTLSFYLKQEFKRLVKPFRAGSILDINETFVIHFQKRIVHFKPMDITEYVTPRQVLHSVNFVKQTYLGDSHFPAKLEEKCKKIFVC